MTYRHWPNKRSDRTPGAHGLSRRCGKCCRPTPGEGVCRQLCDDLLIRNGNFTEAQEALEVCTRGE